MGLNFRILKVIFIVFVLIATPLILILIFRSKTPKSPDVSITNDTSQKTTLGFDKNNYSIDTDSDLLPDFIETRLSLDPNNNEVSSCYSNKCNDPAFQQAYIKKHNIVIILDSSGSMDLKTGEVTKMEAAKQAITAFMKNVGSEAQIGLIQYGHLGSNQTKDKDLSCSSSEILAPIGSLNAGNVSTVLASVKSTGWTAIGLALQKTQEMFVGKEKDDNEVFVVTDGAETCNTDPVATAKALATGPAHIKVNVIGFAVTDEEKVGLEAINIAGEGSYSSAKNSSELEDIFTRNLQNYTSLLNANDCVDSVIKQIDLCILGLHNKIDNFRQSYVDSTPPVSRDEYEINESLYYKYIMYLQDFHKQKTSELMQIKTGYVNKL